MKKYIPIILLFLVACRKHVEEVKPTLPPPSLHNDVIQMTESDKPALSITATQINNFQVQIIWKKQGNKIYTVKRSTDEGLSWKILTTCNCYYYIDNVTAGKYLYQVNESNVAIVFVVPAPTYPKGVLRLSYDPYNLNPESQWRTWINFTLSGSGMEQWKRDSVTQGVNEGFQRQNINVAIVLSGAASQTAVITESSSWYGSAGGTSMLNSYGTGTECFVFSQLLQYKWQYIRKAVMHELGHTFGLSHTLQAGNWMNNVFEEVPQQYGDGVITEWGQVENQLQMIHEKTN